MPQNQHVETRQRPHHRIQHNRAEIFGEHDLEIRHGRRHQHLQRARALFLRQQSHGDHRHDHQRRQPEHAEQDLHRRKLRRPGVQVADHHRKCHSHHQQEKHQHHVSQDGREIRVQFPSQKWRHVRHRSTLRRCSRRSSSASSSSCVICTKMSSNVVRERVNSRNVQPLLATA